MKSFYKYLIPSVISSILMSTYAIIDGIFIGQRIGDIGLSAINMAWPITSFLQCIGTALGLSGGIYISSLKGMNKEEEANRLKLTTILIILGVAVVLGILLFFTSKPLLIGFGATDTCLEYAHSYIKIILVGSAFQMLGLGLLPLLKNSGKVKFAMAGSITSIVVNLILDYFMIYHLNMGLQGAALASVLAQVMAFCVCFIPYFKELKGIWFCKRSIRNILIGAMAPFILNFSYSFIIIITNALCVRFGGNEAVAAYTLLSYLLYVVGAMGTGVADAIQPLFSYHASKKEYKMNRVMLRKCLLISFILCIATCILFYFLKKPLQALYNLSDLAAEYYSTGSVYYLIGFLFVSLIRVISSYFYSINQKLLANLMTLTEPLCLTPVIYAILCSILKLNGIWIGFLVIQGMLFIMSLILLKINFTKEKKECIEIR